MLNESILLLIMLTFAASAFLHLGYSFQKKGASKLLGVQFGLKTLSRYLNTTRWTIGIVYTVTGTALIILALRLGPISTVQPLLGSGLIFIVLFSKFYLKEQINKLDYVAIFLVVAGVIFLGLSTSRTDINIAHYEPKRLFGYMVLILVIIALIQLFLAVVFSGKKKDIRYGIFSGVFYAFASLFIRAMFNANQNFPQSNFLWFIPLAVASALLGLSLIQKGFYHGRAVIVVVFNDIVNQLTVISGGIFCFKERMPADPLRFTIKICSFVLIIAGSIILSRVERSTPEDTI